MSHFDTRDGFSESGWGINRCLQAVAFSLPFVFSWFTISLLAHFFRSSALTKSPSQASSVRKSFLSCFSRSIVHKATIKPKEIFNRKRETLGAWIGESLLTFKANLCLNRFWLISICVSFRLWSSYLNNLSEYRKSITISIICENLSRTYRIVLEKLSLKTSKLYKERMGGLKHSWLNIDGWLKHYKMNSRVFFPSTCYAG